MSLLQWKDEFRIGIPAVDFEHQELIELINELHDDLMRPGPEARTREFLGELYAKIAAHFALEERVMREAGYDQYADHKGDHEILLDELTDIMDAVGEDASGMEEHLASTLDTWFTEHFKTRDARLHKSLG